MPTNNLNQKTSLILSIIFSILLAFLTIISGWQMNLISKQNEKIEMQNERLTDLPEKYVRLERYICDLNSLKDAIKDLGDKIDRSITARNRSGQVK